MVHLENRIVDHSFLDRSMPNTLLPECSVFGTTCVITGFSQINFSCVTLFSLGSPFSESRAEQKQNKAKLSHLLNCAAVEVHYIFE